MDQRLFTIRPIAKDSLHRKIADVIIDYIKANKLTAGAKLPSERVLAEQFSTSRNSVREALRVLENEGIIEVKTGKGAYVISSPTEGVVSIKLWKVEYEELLGIKFLLEKCIVEELCNRTEEINLDELDNILSQMEEAAQNGVYLQKLDYVFHNRLRNMTSNSALEQLLANLTHTLDSFYVSVLKGVDHIWISTLPYHRKMLEGIQEHNKEKATNACMQIFQTDLHAIHLKEEYDL